MLALRCQNSDWLAPNVLQIYAVADCGLLSCRTAPRLKRRSWFHNPSEKRQLTYILLLGAWPSFSVWFNISKIKCSAIRKACPSIFSPITVECCCGVLIFFTWGFLSCQVTRMLACAKGKRQALLQFLVCVRACRELQMCLPFCVGLIQTTHTLFYLIYMSVQICRGDKNN